MPGTDVLLSLPTESVAVRATLASLVALVLVRLLLRSGLQLPRARATAVLVPTLALISVVVLSWTDIALPSVMVSIEGHGGVVEGIRVGNRYLDLAPLGWPLVAGLWGAVAGLKLTLRGVRLVRVHHALRAAFAAGEPCPPEVTRALRDLAKRLRVAVPPVAIVPDIPGGATVVGVRRPVLLIDRDLLASLDDEELEGLLAHELAHVRRRDNLLALLAGVARDLAFFVPGGRWVLRELHAEREAAADQHAVEVTDRPGALASGLLKVLDHARPAEACAAFSPGPGSLEARVRRLCAEPPSSLRLRRVGEVAATGGVLAAAVLAAVQLPALVADHVPTGGGERADVLALLWAGSVEQAPVQERPEAAAFSVYRVNRARPAADADGRGAVVDDGRELNPALLHVDPIDGRSPAERVGWSPLRRRSLGLGSGLQIEDDLVERWRATAVFEADQGLSLWWLSRLAEATAPAR